MGEGAVEIAGRRLAWRSVGNGPPLLLVNGYAAGGGDWDPEMLMRLSRSFEVICPDNRGMGGSELGEGELTVASMADDLLALLDGLGLESVHLAGWSMGGFIAQRLALAVPERIERLALLSTDPGGPHSVPPAPEVWMALTDHSGTPRERATRLISLLFPAQLAPQLDEQFGETVASARAALSMEALRAQEGAMLAWHAEDQPKWHGDPPSVLIAHGSEDAVIPAANTNGITSWRSWNRNREKNANLSR